MSNNKVSLQDAYKELGFSESETENIKEEAKYIEAIYSLKEQRRKLGLTQTELAMKSGVSRPMLSKIESGNRNATLETLMRVAHAMDKRVEISLK